MKATLIINIFTAIFVFTVGLLFLLNIIPSNFSTSTRIIFSTVFLGYGIYRFISFITKMNIEKQNTKREKLLNETEKLIHGVSEEKK